MKKLLLFSLVTFFQLYFTQILFEPYVNHSYQSYTATLKGNGTIYYTTDGSDPTINSASGYQNVNLTISSNTLVKARLKNSAGQLSDNIESKNYYYGELPSKTVYFKPPTNTNWNTNNVCVWPSRIDPGTLVDYTIAQSMINADCEGWYKYTYPFYKAGFTFSNCKFSYLDPLHQSTPFIETEETLFYDFTEGPISNPPACLLAVSDPSKKVAVVKIFPNPVQDYVNIESDKNFIAYEIIDENGKLISSKDFKGSKIDISNLKTGVYFVKLKTLSNETNIVKFIKK